MKNLKYLFLVAVFAGLIFLLSGCNGTQVIKVEYLPGSEAQSWFSEADLAQIKHQPTVAVNPLWDDRQTTDRIGDGYNTWGGKVETWVSDQNPTDIIQDALINQLEKAGFKVVKITGWNLTPETIPQLSDVDFILSGRLKAFWVESHPGFWTVSVNSKTSFDLVIADVKTKKIIWSGQFTGADTKENFIRTKDSMRASISRSLTQAVNKVFQDEQAKHAIFTILKIKF